MNNILIVDDEEEIRISLAEALVEMGYKVVTARNGKIAMQKLKEVEVTPDLILLDLKMPEKNGWDFLHDLQSNNDIPHIPLVLVTGALVRKDNLEDLGVTGVVLKPYDKLELQHVVRGAIDGARA